MLAQWEVFTLPNDWGAVALVEGSAFLGVVVGVIYCRDRDLAQWIRRNGSFVQQFLSYDFYTEQLYTWLVVIPFGWASRVVSGFDRYVVDGVVNVVGLATLVGSEGLKYSGSGRLQGYVLTIVLGVLLLGTLVLPILQIQIFPSLF